MTVQGHENVTGTGITSLSYTSTAPNDHGLRCLGCSLKCEKRRLTLTFTTSSKRTAVVVSISTSARRMTATSRVLRIFTSHCSHSIYDGYELGPLRFVTLARVRVCQGLLFSMAILLPESIYDLPTREKCVPGQSLYPNSILRIIGGCTSNFCFSHDNLHGAHRPHN
jgi:hypothetical protein